MAEGKGCSRCGDRMGHRTELGAAHCAYRIATTAAIRLQAQELGADKVAAADLLAHLRSALSDEAAYRSARYVLDLGWRPTVGVSS